MYVRICYCNYSYLDVAYTIGPDVTPTPVNSTLDGNHEVMLSTIIKTPAPDNSTFEGNHEVTLSTIIIFL